MNESNRNEVKGQKYSGTMIKREALICVYGRHTTSTYTQEELQKCIERCYPHYLKTDGGGR